MNMKMSQLSSLIQKIFLGGARCLLHRMHEMRSNRNWVFFWGGGTGSPPACPGQSPGGGSGGEDPEKFLIFTVKKTLDALISRSI